MFKKVLIAEDQDFMNASLRAILNELGVEQDTRDYVTYCDDALMRVKKAISDLAPYELLITDLSFEQDFQKQEIASGPELIKAVRNLQPDIKVLVFSVDDRRSKADALFAHLQIDGYVPKTRRAIIDFKAAVTAIYKDKKYYSPNLKQYGHGQREYKFTPYERDIVSLLYQGKSQKEIAAYFKKNKIKPDSLSNIEKTLKHLKNTLDVATPLQLIAYCRDNKII